MNIEIKKLTSQDLDQFIELICVFENVFEMENFAIPDHKHLSKILENQKFMVFIALDNNTVIGGLTAYTLEQYYTEKPSAYLYDLAIATIHQRKGIGKALLNYFNEYCTTNHYKEVFVQADIEDDHAIEFYRSTGGNEMKVLHFTYPLEDKV